MILIFQFNLNDLNISGLNTWREFSSLQPYDALQLFTHLSLDNFTIYISFSLRIKLNNNSKLVKEDYSILYEEGQFSIKLNNNKMKAFLQFPFNDKRAKEYSNQECLNMDCVMNLIDSNGRMFKYGLRYEFNRFKWNRYYSFIIK